MKYVKTEGQTPAGAKFELLAGWDSERGPEIICRRLEWLPGDEVGAIGIPLKITAPVGQLFYELTRNGKISEETSKASFAT